MILRMFGIGVKKALAGDQTEGTVTHVKTCWWLKINTKPARRHALDGAVFPHIIHFTYSVDGEAYRGKRYVNWNKRCPEKGEKLRVCYELRNPAKYAISI